MALPDITGSFCQISHHQPAGLKSSRDVSFRHPQGSVRMVLGQVAQVKHTDGGVLGLWRTTSGEIRIDGAEAAAMIGCSLSSNRISTPEY